MFPSRKKKIEISKYNGTSLLNFTFTYHVLKILSKVKRKCYTNSLKYEKNILLHLFYKTIIIDANIYNIVASKSSATNNNNRILNSTYYKG